MIIPANNKNYNIIICNDNNTINNMIDSINQYILMKERRIIGIDFEFNRVKNSRKIALCQINMEIEGYNNPSIYLFYPPDITKKSDILVKLLTTPHIIKILHGGESLDIPYLFSEILTTDKNRRKFCDYLYDTSFLCSYYNIENNLINNKCRIYELLKQMKVIDKQKYDYLEHNDKMMGNIWEIDIDVKKMSKNVIIYCLYDVIYLPTLFNCFPSNDIYMKLLPSITSYNMMIRYDKTIDVLFKYISSYNNKVIIIGEDKYSFNDIYNTVYYWLSSYSFLYILFQINYFKKFFEIFIKDLLYSILDMNFKSYLKAYFKMNEDTKVDYTIDKFRQLISLYIDNII